MTMKMERRFSYSTTGSVRAWVLSRSPCPSYGAGGPQFALLRGAASVHLVASHELAARGDRSIAGVLRSSLVVRGE